MMRFNPGASVRVYFPKRSMVQSYPCGTVLTPANNVKTTSSTSTMAKISKPSMKNLLKAKTTVTPAQRTATMCQALQCNESLLVADQGCKVRRVEKPADHDPIESDHDLPSLVEHDLFGKPVPAFPDHASDPALKLAQHQLANHVHAGVAVVEAGDRRELLTAIVLKYLGVLLRDFFQRFQAIGGEAGRDDGDAAHAVLGKLGYRLVGVGLQPLVEAETR